MHSLFKIRQIHPILRYLKKVHFINYLKQPVKALQRIHVQYVLVLQFHKFETVNNINAELEIFYQAKKEQQR